MPAKRKKSPKKSKNGVRKKSAQVKNSFWGNSKLLSLIILGFSFLLYANTLGHKYAVDDAIVLYDNMFTTQGVEGIPGILKKDTFFGFFKDENKAKLVSGGRYRPMTLILFALEREIFGDSPFIGHLMNVIYYGLTGILIFFLLKLILSQRFKPDESVIIAFFSAILFVAHPVHTEVVANIKGRDEIICLLASIATLFLVFKYLKSSSIKLLFLIFMSFFIGLMSKENAITFLAVAPLIYYYFYSTGSIKKIGYAWACMLLAAFLFMAIRTSILGFEFGGNPPAELMNNPFLKLVGNVYVPFSSGEKAATILFTLGKYIQLLAFPHPLIHDYYPRAIDIMTFGDWKVLLSLVIYIGIMILAILGFRKKNIISFGILYFLMTISIVSNIVFPVGTNMSERFLFMPSLGFSLIISYLIYRFLFKKTYIFYSLISLILLGYSVKTITRNNVWKNDYTLFTNDVKISGNSAKLLNAAGGALVTEASALADGDEKSEMLNQAKSYLTRAIKIHPYYKNAFLLLGNSHFYLREYDEAIIAFQRVLKLYPDYQEAKDNLGITFRDAGRYYGERVGDLDRAINYLVQAYNLRPKEYETVRLLGVAYGIKGNSEGAIKYFTEGTILAPGSADAFLNLGNAYMDYGDEENGRINLQKALDLDPNALNSND